MPNGRCNILAKFPYRLSRVPALSPLVRHLIFCSDSDLLVMCVHPNTLLVEPRELGHGVGVVQVEVHPEWGK